MPSLNGLNRTYTPITRNFKEIGPISPTRTLWKPWTKSKIKEPCLPPNLKKKKENMFNFLLI